jgi:hypothetical protein
MLAEGVVEAFRLQAEFSPRFGSPLYAELLTRAADDLVAGGPVARVLDGWEGRPVPDAVALRLMGGVHRLVLDGEAPELASYYPSVGGTPKWPQTWDAFLHVVTQHAERLRDALQRQVQTNEVRRSAALAAGILDAAAGFGHPLRLLEIGSSAGLNLCWDRYAYEVVLHDGDAAPHVRHVWGERGSPVVVRTDWDGPLDVFATTTRVIERAGCDVAPIDVTDPRQVRTLESFVWGDQLERLAQLRAAVALARHDPPPIARCRAADWLAAQLASPRPHTTTVLFHSVMWWYLSEDERRTVTELAVTAGSRATDAAPFAWLRLELMRNSDPELRSTRWPGGDEQVLGTADPHGRWVRWAITRA